MPLLQWPDHGGQLCPNFWFKHSFCALVDLAYLFDSFHLRFLSQLLSQPFRFVLHKGFGGIAIPLDLLLLPKSRRWNLPKHSLFSLTGATFRHSFTMDIQPVHAPAMALVLAEQCS